MLEMHDDSLTVKYGTSKRKYYLKTTTYPTSYDNGSVHIDYRLTDKQNLNLLGKHCDKIV